MKKFAVGVLLGFVLSSGLGIAAQSLDHNGTFWSRLDLSAKTGYVDGYSDAMGVSVGKLDNLMVAADLFRWKGAKKIIRQLSRELAISDQNPEDVVKHLNELYSDRKYSELDLGSAVQSADDAERTGAGSHCSRAACSRRGCSCAGYSTRALTGASSSSQSIQNRTGEPARRSFDCPCKSIEACLA